MDDGDPRKKVPHRDSVLTIKAPFTDQPVELFKTEHRFAGGGFGDKGTLVYFTDFDRDKRWLRTFIYYCDKPDVPPKLVSSRNQQDRYTDPGNPVTRVVRGQRAITCTAISFT